MTPRPSLQPSTEPAENSYSSAETLSTQPRGPSLVVVSENQNLMDEDHEVATPNLLLQSLSPPNVTLSSRAEPSPDFGLSSLSITTTQPSDSGLNVHSRRVSDLSVLSVDDSQAEPYDVRDEITPPAPFLSPGFQDTLKKGVEIAKAAATAIEAVQGFLEPGRHGERLFADARRLSNFRCSNTRTIAFLGDSGEGKGRLN